MFIILLILISVYFIAKYLFLALFSGFGNSEPKNHTNITNINNHLHISAEDLKKIIQQK
jgi:hypothetical protein